MNYNKKIIIAVGIFFSALLLGLSVIKITINIMYPGNELSESIKESFKDSFGKAIKFDSLEFNYNGDISLQNFYLSNTSDFNDNINLIKCSEVVIETSLIDLLRRKMVFSSLYMYEPEINIIKNYGKSYYDTFIEDILTGIKKDKVSLFVRKKFRIKLVDAQLFYREIFKNTKTSIDFHDVDLSIQYNNNKITYNADGKIINRNISWWHKSGFSTEGEIDLDTGKTDNEIEFKNIDISLFNNIIAEKMNNPITLSGVLSGDFNLITSHDSFFIKGDIDGSDINALSISDSSNKIIKDKNLNIVFALSSSYAGDKIIIHKLKIDDDILKITLSMEYIKNDYISLKTESNKIDLDDLSDTFSPVKNCRYNGELKFFGTCRYNLKELKPDSLALDVKLNNFNLVPSENYAFNLMRISDCNAILSADKDKVLLKAALQTGETDINLSFTSNISEWNPLKSLNQLNITSKKMDISLIKYTFLACINSIYNMAYVDMFQNFDEQKNFLKEPEGIFFNNNDLKISINADKLGIARNTSLNNFGLQLNLIKGNVQTEKFTLDGYEGTFSFDAHASLHQDYPFIKIGCGVENLNLTQIAAASDSEIPAGGIMSAGFSYETNAFRVGQIVENGKATVNLSIKNGYFSNTDTQKKINEFIKNNGYSENIPAALTFRDFSFEFHQSANEYYIKNFKLDSDQCSFSAYGKYLEDEGLDIPLSLNFKINNNYTKVPLLLTGKLTAPCVRINTKKNKEQICF